MSCLTSLNFKYNCTERTNFKINSNKESGIPHISVSIPLSYCIDIVLVQLNFYNDLLDG